MRMTEWSDEDSKLANMEGWDIFNCEGSDNGPYQLDKIYDPEGWGAETGIPVFRTWEDDTDVWVFVRDTPTALHTRALLFLEQANPQEHKAILAFGKEETK